MRANVDSPARFRVSLSVVRATMAPMTEGSIYPAETLIMCADHGDAFGEDGYHGRGIAHPTVLNVPFAVWLSE